MSLRRPVSTAAIVVCAAILVVETLAWSWNTSGVLQATQNWVEYPWGFAATTTVPGVGDWTLLKENFNYIGHHQAFLGVPGEYVRPAYGFEHMRTLYGFLTAGLWVLGPVFSGLLCNVALWALACVCGHYVARTIFPDDPHAPWVAVALVLSGQGFVDSVGEVSPHVLGYGLAFYIAAYACKKRLWTSEASPFDHYAVHGFLGILKLAYESAWLAFPFLFAVSVYWAWRTQPARRVRFLATCAAGSLVPGLGMIILSRPFGSADSATASLGAIGEHSFITLAKSYVLIYLDAVVALGPTLVILSGIGIAVAISRRDRASLVLTGLIAAVIGALAVLFLGVTARGYTTFALEMPLLLLVLPGYRWLASRSSPLRYLAPALLVLAFAWTNAPRFGWKPPVLGFSWGYLRCIELGHCQAYSIHELR